MQVDLRQLRENPMRDFTVDPIDRAGVETLKASIHEHGFWGGIACRQRTDGSIEIAAGHHRVVAALDAGVTTADVFVRTDMTNEEMVRLYAKENATQRGTTSTAMAGTVASAVRFLAKAVLTQRPLPAGVEISTPAFETQGIGWRPVWAFLQAIPGVTSSTIQQQLANLKASGDYGRIMAEVAHEIAAEHEATLKRLAEEEAFAEQARQTEAARQAREARERAQADQAVVAERATRTTAKAAEHERIFDFEGVAQHLKNAHQVAVFRTAVTGAGIRPLLAVGDQAALAKHLVELAQSRGMELSGAFLRENITNLILASKDQARARTKAEHEELLRQNRLRQAQEVQEDFIRRVYAMAVSGHHLTRFREQWPDEEEFPWTRALARALQDAKVIVDALVKPHESPDRGASGPAGAGLKVKAPAPQRKER